MSGDPVEEGAVAVRTGFIQAMQTAQMTSNMIRGWGAEGRSAADFQRRTAEGVAKEGREAEIHDLKVDGYHDRHRRETALHKLETEFKLGQQHRVSELHELEKKVKNRQMERADADLDRRNTDGILERANKSELHSLDKQWRESRDQRAEELHELEKQVKTRQMERADADLDRRNSDGIVERANKDELHGLDKLWREHREQRAVELHELDREYKQLLIDARRRALGLSEILAAQDPDNAAANHAVAEFAAAHSNRDLSAQHAQNADAYAERFTQDTGVDPDELIDEALADVSNTAGSTGPRLSALRDLTAQLTADTHTEHLLATEASTGADQDAEVVVAEAVEAAGLTGDQGAGPVMDEPAGVDLDVGPPMMSLDLDRGLEP